MHTEIPSYQNQNTTDAVDSASSIMMDGQVSGRYEAEVGGVDVQLSAALAQALDKPENTLEPLRELFARHNLTVADPAAAPNCSARSLEELLHAADWQRIQHSPIPTTELWSAYNTRQAEAAWNSIERPNTSIAAQLEGNKARMNEAALRAMPLTVTMSAANFEHFVSRGSLASARTLRTESNKSAIQNAAEGNLLLHDGMLGLDGVVYANVGHPHPHYMYDGQPEIIMLVDPKVMEAPGTFLTREEYIDLGGTKVPPVVEYMNGAVTPADFYDNAQLRIATAVRLDGGKSSGEYIPLTVGDFAEGIGGDVDTKGRPTFNGWEAKLPEGAVTRADVPVVVVRDEATFQTLQNTYGDMFRFTHNPDVKPSTANRSEIGNYQDVFVIPGRYDAEYAELERQDYDGRAEALSRVPPERQVEAWVALADDPAVSSINRHSNLDRTRALSTRMYPTAQDLANDVRHADATALALEFWQAPWFFNVQTNKIEDREHVVVKVTYDSEDMGTHCITGVYSVSPANPEQIHEVLPEAIPAERSDDDSGDE